MVDYSVFIQASNSRDVGGKMDTLGKMDMGGKIDTSLSGRRSNAASVE